MRLYGYEILEDNIFISRDPTLAFFTLFNCVLYTRDHSIRAFPPI